MSPALEAWSLNHWTSREAPTNFCYNKIQLIRWLLPEWCSPNLPLFQVAEIPPHRAPPDALLGRHSVRAVVGYFLAPCFSNYTPSGAMELCTFSVTFMRKLLTCNGTHKKTSILENPKRIHFVWRKQKIFITVNSSIWPKTLEIHDNSQVQPHSKQKWDVIPVAIITVSSIHSHQLRRWAQKSSQSSRGTRRGFIMGEKHLKALLRVLPFPGQRGTVDEA